jgi:hypothetical protein
MRPHPRRARTDPAAPSAWGTSDRSGFVGNHRDMTWQMEFAGTQLINKRILVYSDEYDTPQPQLQTIVLPPDPTPVMNARPEQYFIDEWPVSTRYTTDGRIRVTQYAPYPQERVCAVSGDL